MGRGVCKSSIEKMLHDLKRGSPTILTCASVIGVVATTVLAVKATPKAITLICQDSRANHGGDPEAYTNVEAIQSAWKCYIPSALTGVATIYCIVGANVLNRRQQASMASAYAFVSNAYGEYKQKVKELYGKEAHNRIVDSIAEDHCKDVYISASGFAGSYSLDFEDHDPADERLFYDSFSKRYFKSSVNRVIQAEYHFNRNFMLSGCISVNDFYDFLGLEPLDFGDEIGWGFFDETYWVDFDHHKKELDDGVECFVIDMAEDPYKIDDF